MSLGLTFLVLASVPWNVLCGMEVDLYVHKDKFGKLYRTYSRTLLCKMFEI